MELGRLNKLRLLVSSGTIRIWPVPLILLLLSGISVFSSPPSPSSSFSVLTLEPGHELYTVFGHSAIRFTDRAENIDKVYNFGAFDFSTRGFYLKFIRGDLQYYLSVNQFADLLVEAFIGHRTLYEQQLNLTTGEKARLIGILDSLVGIGYHYPYAFFGDNCSTRIRDIFYRIGIDSIEFNHNGFIKGQSYRDMIAPYLAERPLIHTGVDILLGPGADKIVSHFKSMFLPRILLHAIDHARIIEDQKTRFLAFSPEILFSAFKRTPTKQTLFPWFVYGLILLLFFISVFEMIRGPFYVWIDVFVFGFSGLLGVLLITLWIWSRHPELQNNINLLWASPLNLFLLTGLISHKIKTDKLYLCLCIVSILMIVLFTIILLCGVQHMLGTTAMLTLAVFMRELRFALRLWQRIYN